MEERRVPYLPYDLIFEILVRCSEETLRQTSSSAQILELIVRSSRLQKAFALRKSLIVSDSFLVAIEYDETEWKFWVSRFFHQEGAALLSSTPTLYLKSLNYANGLVCSGYAQDCTVINPTNGMSRVCPRFSEDMRVKTFIGFCHETSQFKLMGMSNPKGKGGKGFEPFVNHKVLCLDKKLCSWIWKPVNCIIPHEPQSRSVCIGDDLYYAAYLSRTKIAMMRFNLKTEVFASNPIPETAKFTMFSWETDPFNIKGKVAISFFDDCGKHRIWTLEDVHENRWSLLILETPRPILDEITLLDRLVFQGLTRTGDMLFTKAQGSHLVVYHHSAETDEVQRNLMELVVSGGPMLLFWDHVESIMFI